MTENQLKYLAHQENVRHNVATETNADAKLDEEIRKNTMTHELGQQNLAETHRANVTKEHETARSNLARETETHRSNLVGEAQQDRALKLKTAETIYKGIESGTKSLKNLSDIATSQQSTKTSTLLAALKMWGG